MKKDYLNLNKARHTQVRSDYFSAKRFKNSKAPKKIMRMYLFSMSRDGTKTTRDVLLLSHGLALLGGFITSCFYGTYFTYRIIS